MICSEYLQVLGFLLLCPFGADLTATGGSGAQLRGDEGEHTLHHPTLHTERGPCSLIQILWLALTSTNRQ